LDLSSAPSVREVLSDALEENPVELVLDLADLNYVDSTGLSLFVGAKKRAQTSGTRLVLRNLQSGTQRLLEITGLKDSFDLDD
jgi:anti-sigma B factor antagonist